jgi:hypothetical protein
MSHNHTYNSNDLTKSLDKALEFIQSEKTRQDPDLLITIQSFSQRITSYLENYLDSSK